MKAYDIAIFLIFLMLSMNILIASNVFGTDININYGTKISILSSTVQSSGYAPSEKEEISYSELAISAFGLLVKSLIVIIMIFAYATILLPIFLYQLSLPGEINTALTIGVWIIYIIGYAQYKSRSSLLGSE